MTNEHVVGFDWDEEGGHWVVTGPRGKEVARGEVTSTPEGLRTLLNVLDAHRDDTGARPVLVLEMTRRPLVRALQDNGVTVLGINPATLHGSRAGRKQSKSDPLDARRLANRYRTDEHDFRPLSRYSADAYELTLLTRLEKQASLRATEAAGRVRSLLAEFYPAPLACWTAADLADDLVAVTVLLRAPTPTQGLALTEDEIVELVASTGKRSHITSEAKKAFHALQTPFLTYPGATEEAWGQALTILLTGLRSSIIEKLDLEHRLQDVAKHHPFMPLIRPALGAGPKVIARLIGEIGDERLAGSDAGAALLARFPHAKGFRAFAGVVPLDQSSHSRQRHVRRDVKGNRMHRALWDWAEVARQHSPGAMHLYWTARSKGDGHPTAIRKVADKIATRLHHCLTHQIVWDEAHAWPNAPTLDAAKALRDEVRANLTKRRREGQRRPVTSPAEAAA